MNRLKELLIKYGCPEDANTIEDTFDICSKSFTDLRDILIKIGTILEEIEEEKIYVAVIPISRNPVTIAAQLTDNSITILSYAKEGLIKQNSAKKAIYNIKEELLDTCEANKSCEEKSFIFRKKVFLPAIITAVLLILLAILSITVIPVCDSIKEYNVAADTFNSYVDEYNSAVSKTCIDNIEGFPETIGKIKIEDDSVLEGFSVALGKNSISKIKADTEIIHTLTEQLQHYLKTAIQITSPSGEWVEERIKSVEGITGTQPVTEENNPNGLLNKEGGYSACIYFTVDKIDDKKVKGNSIVEKGTDAGGAVEVYASLEDAEERCKYLSEFDGTIFYSGSYAIVGTMVVRTSYLLTNEEQFELTDKITRALTME